MNWKEIHEVPSGKNLDKTRMQSSVNPEMVNKQVETYQHEVPNTRVSGRERKTPVIRSNDFLW
jgi:hypothetical protein